MQCSADGSFGRLVVAKDFCAERGRISRGKGEGIGFKRGKGEWGSAVSCGHVPLLSTFNLASHCPLNSPRVNRHGGNEAVVACAAKQGLHSEKQRADLYQ